MRVRPRILLLALLVSLGSSDLASGRGFIRGDVDRDGALGLPDAVRLLFALFVPGATAPCPDAADLDDDGTLALGDAIGLLEFLFARGAPPRAPFPRPGFDPTAEDPLPCAPGTILVATTDFLSAAALVAISGLPPRTPSSDLLSIHTDAVLRQGGEHLFVIERFGADRVRVLDADDPLRERNVYSVGEGTNPQDIEVVGPGKAYLSRYNSTELLILDPLTGEVEGTIDLSRASDGDGLPEMAEMVQVGNLVFVALQRLDRDQGFLALNDSQLVVIDTATDMVIAELTLEGRNPFEPPVYVPELDRIYLSMAGTFATDDPYGGIEVIDPRSLRSEGLLVTDDALGGSPGALVVRDRGRGYVVGGLGQVFPFHPESGEVGPPLADVRETFVPALAIDGDGFLYVADRLVTAGVLVFDTRNDARIGEPLVSRLPPAAFLALEAGPH